MGFGGGEEDGGGRGQAAEEETAAGLARRVAMNRALFEAALRVGADFTPFALTLHRLLYTDYFTPGYCLRLSFGFARILHRLFYTGHAAPALPHLLCCTLVMRELCAISRQPCATSAPAFCPDSTSLI